MDIEDATLSHIYIKIAQQQPSLKWDEQLLETLLEDLQQKAAEQEAGPSGAGPSKASGKAAAGRRRTKAPSKDAEAAQPQPEKRQSKGSKNPAPESSPPSREARPRGSGGKRPLPPEAPPAAAKSPAKKRTRQR